MQPPKYFLSYLFIQITLEKLRSILSRFSNLPSARGAFYVMYPSRINDAISMWKKHLPDVKPYYAVKCNPAPQLLHHLYDAGIGFDCASERELLEVQKLARYETAKRIVYANPCKSKRDIRIAKEMGAPITVVDSIEEVEKLEGYEGGALIRIAVDDSGSAMPFSSKFGATNVAKIHDAAKATGLDIRGISFHVGSGSIDMHSHANAIRAAYKHIIYMGPPQQDSPTIIDIGGGYLADPNKFWFTATTIRKAMHEINEDDGYIDWIAEPGRFLAANSFDFFVQVIGKKNSVSGWKYTIDDSLYGQFSGILFDYSQPLWVRISPEGSTRRRSPGVIFGRTCDSIDVIAKAIDMEELEVGDWLWYPGMGAYTRATASEFNGFPAPEIFINTESVKLSLHDYMYAAPTGVSRMPPVSAKAFWAKN